MLSYDREGEAILHQQAIDQGHTLGLRASSVRQERTGVHSRLEILMNRAVLAWSNMNVEKDEERVRIVNSAYTHISANGLKATYPKEYLKHTVDQFCAGLWDQHIGSTMPELLVGTTDPRPPCFLLEPYVIVGGGTILFAPPGRGKSWTMLLMAVSMDAGLEWPWRTRPAKTLFINLERSAKSISDRLGAVNAVLGLPRERPLLVQNARGRSLADVLPSARKAIEQHGVECVMLDSISRAGFGDLNENRPVNAIVDALNGLCDTWVALGHTPRSDESHVFGSVHFDAGADVVVQLLSEQDEDGPLGIGLQVTKKNDFGHRPTGVLALEFSELGLVKVRDAKRSEFPNIDQGKQSTMKHEVKQLLLDDGPKSATQVATALGRNRTNISNLLNTDATFVVVRREGQSVLYGVRHG